MRLWKKSIKKNKKTINRFNHTEITTTKKKTFMEWTYIGGLPRHSAHWTTILCCSVLFSFCVKSKVFRKIGKSHAELVFPGEHILLWSSGQSSGLCIIGNIHSLALLSVFPRKFILPLMTYIKPNTTSKNTSSSFLTPLTHSPRTKTTHCRNRGTPLSVGYS